MKKIFLIILICLSAATSNAQAVRKHVSPGASEILDSIAKGSKTVRMQLFGVADGASTSPPMADLLSGNLKLDLVKQLASLPRSVDMKVSGASGAGTMLDTSSANPIGASLKVIGAMTYPSGASAMTTTGAWRSDSTVTTFNAEIQKVLDYCDAKINSSTAEYWFEIVPMHLYCHALNRQNLVSYKKQMNMNDSASSDPYVMVSDDFNWVRDHASAELASAAIVFDSLKRIDGDATFIKNKARCFPVGRPKVETVLGSAGVTFVQDTASPTTITLAKVESTTMPEPNYALGASSMYYNDTAGAATAGGSASDAAERNLLFNNEAHSSTPTSLPSFSATPDSYKTFSFDSQGVLQFVFKLRDIHRATSPTTCNWFCSHPFTPKDAKPEKSS